MIKKWTWEVTKEGMRHAFQTIFNSLFKVKKCFLIKGKLHCKSHLFSIYK
jgi:hypothetical protein